MPRLRYRIELNTRAINFVAVVTFRAMGKYVTDFLSYYRRSDKGYVVTKVDDHTEDIPLTPGMRDIYEEGLRLWDAQEQGFKARIAALEAEIQALKVAPPGRDTET